MTATAARTDTVFSIDPQKSAWRIVDGEAVLIHAETTYYYGLNGTGTWVWQQLLEDDLSAEMLCRRLGGEIDGERATLEIADFLSGLEEEELIEPASPSQSEAAPEQVGAALSVEWSAPEMTRYSTLEDLIVCGE